ADERHDRRRGEPHAARQRSAEGEHVYTVGGSRRLRVGGDVGAKRVEQAGGRLGTAIGTQLLGELAIGEWAHDVGSSRARRRAAKARLSRLRIATGVMCSSLATSETGSSLQKWALTVKRRSSGSLR